MIKKIFDVKNDDVGRGSVGLGTNGDTKDIFFDGF